MCFFVLEAQFLTLMLTWDSCRVCVLGYSLAWLGSIVDLVQDCGLETLHMFQCLGVRWPMARLKVVCGKAFRCLCFSQVRTGKIIKILLLMSESLSAHIINAGIPSQYESIAVCYITFVHV